MSEVRPLDPADEAAALAAARLLHDFNTEYDSPTPGPEAIAARLREVVASGWTAVHTAYEEESLGVAVVRYRPSLWSRYDEATLAELYVVPERRGQGLGVALMTAFVDDAERRGCDFLEVVTSDDDVAAWHLYERFAFIRTEGPGGPLSRYYEREIEQPEV